MSTKDEQLRGIERETQTATEVVSSTGISSTGIEQRIKVLEEWVREHGLRDLNPRAMEPCFDAVEQAIHVQAVPEEMRSAGTRKFAEGAARRGYPLKRVRRNTNDCLGCSRCNFVCPHGRKLSVDVSYLPRAVQAGARIYSRCLVERVETSGSRAVR